MSINVCYPLYLYLFQKVQIFFFLLQYGVLSTQFYVGGHLHFLLIKPFNNIPDQTILY